ncbi:MAG: hypothetical protein C4291_03235 [Candidatus Dadabacteria bacterium]
MTGNKVNDFGTKARREIILIILFVCLSVVVSVFNSFFSASQFLRYKADEIGRLFEGRRDFTQVAKELLSARTDIVYLKLLDENGILKESLGREGEIGVKKFRLSMPDGYTVIAGLKEIKPLILHPLLWSVAVGIFFSGIYLMVSSPFSKRRDVQIESVIMGIKRVSRGDLTSRLDMDKDVQNDPLMIRLFESFNQMVDQIKRKEDISKETPKFQPIVVVSDKKEEPKVRMVTAFVAKIADFETLSARLGAAEFSSFLTQYRKAVSSIVSDYGGVIEALLQDEIVALFNVPDEQDKPELRAVCAAVEVLEVLANMSRKRKVEGKEPISGKIGIEARAIPFYIESGIPQGVKEVIGLARAICEDAPVWKVLISSEIYKSVSDYVDAKEMVVNYGTSFSIVSVEEGVIRV